MPRSCKRTTIVRSAVTAGLVGALLCTGAIAPRSAAAATIEELQEQVDQASKAYDDATHKVEELQAKADEAQAKIDEVQAQLPEQREKTSAAVRSMYKIQQDSPGLVTLLLTSEDFTDFITTYQYINAVQQDNFDETQRLAQMESDLLAAQQTVNAAKEEAASQQQQAADSMSQAQASLNLINQQIIQQQEAARAEAEAQAAAQAQQAASEQASSTEAASTDAATTDAAGAPKSETNPAPESSNPAATDGTEVNDEGEWMIGTASAYDVADNTGGSATASGEILTPNSVTVAVPVSQRYLLGRTCQVRWNGITVNARVTDTGGFAAYGRALDLAGGVWKAFGFSSPNEWGVRTVQYRFL